MRVDRPAFAVAWVALLAFAAVPAAGGGGASLAAARRSTSATRADSTRSAASVESLVVRTSLPNGMELCLLSRKNPGREVGFAFELRFGDESSLRGFAAAGEMAGGSLMRGTVDRRHQDIVDELNHLESRLWIDGTVSSATGGGSAPRENLAAVLSLAAEILRRPSFPDSEFARLRREKIVLLGREAVDPVRVCWYSLARHLEPWPPDDPRYQPTAEEQIDRLRRCTREDAVAFHRRFYGASHGVFSAVGDFDPREVTAQLGRLLGDWSSSEPQARLSLALHPAPVIHERFEVPGARRAVFHAATVLELRDDDPAYPALVLATYLLGGPVRGSDTGGFDSRFNAWFYADDAQTFGRWGARAGCLARDADSVAVHFHETLVRALRDGFTPEEVAKGKERWRVQRCLERGENEALAGALDRLTLIGRTLSWDQALDEKVRHVTPAELQAALRRFLDPATISTAVAGDFVSPP